MGAPSDRAANHHGPRLWIGLCASNRAHRSFASILAIPEEHADPTVRCGFVASAAIDDLAARDVPSCVGFVSSDSIKAARE